MCGASRRTAPQDWSRTHRSSDAPSLSSARRRRDQTVLLQYIAEVELAAGLGRCALARYAGRLADRFRRVPGAESGLTLMQPIPQPAQICQVVEQGGTAAEAGMVEMSQA